MEPVYLPVIAAARTIFAAQGLHFTVTGSENVPRRGGAVMAINHTGYLDFAHAGYAALPSRRLVRFMAKESVFTHRLSGPLMRGMKHIPVDRQQGANSYAAAVAALRAGEIVGVYPEGTISRSFELKQFKSGAARMAKEAQVPVLPTIVWGSHRVWTKDHPRRLGRHRVPISIDVGEPITVAPDEEVAAATERIREAMTGSLHRLQEAYGPLPEEEAAFVPARLGGAAPTLEEAARREREAIIARATRPRRRRLPGR